MKLTSNTGIFTLQRISTKILLLPINEFVFVCLLLNEPDVTVYKYCLLTFAPTTTTKNLNPPKTLEVPYQISRKSNCSKTNPFLRNVVKWSDTL